MDWCPVISQAKSLVQYMFGDREGAYRTLENFLRTCPLIAVFRWIYHKLVTGDEEEAEEPARQCLQFIDVIPVVGHVKGFCHYAAGNREGGDNAMKSASRTTGSAIGSIVGTVVGGPFGSAVGLAAGGYAMDVITALAEYIIHKEYRPSGYLAVIAKAVNALKDPGAWFDIFAFPVVDGLSLYLATIAQPKWRMHQKIGITASNLVIETAENLKKMSKSGTMKNHKYKIMAVAFDEKTGVKHMGVNITHRTPMNKTVLKQFGKAHDKSRASCAEFEAVIKAQIQHDKIDSIGVVSLSDDKAYPIQPCKPTPTRPESCQETIRGLNVVTDKLERSEPIPSRTTSKIGEVGSVALGFANNAILNDGTDDECKEDNRPMNELCPRLDDANVELERVRSDPLSPSASTASLIQERTDVVEPCKPTPKSYKDITHSPDVATAASLSSAVTGDINAAVSGSKRALTDNVNDRTHNENKPVTPRSDGIFEPVISDHKPVAASTLSNKKPLRDSSVMYPGRNLVCPPIGKPEVTTRFVATTPTHSIVKDMTRSADVATQVLISNSVASLLDPEIGKVGVTAAESVGNNVFSANANNKTDKESKLFALPTDHFAGPIVSDPATLSIEKPPLDPSITTLASSLVCPSKLQYESPTGFEVSMHKSHKDMTHSPDDAKEVFTSAASLSSAVGIREVGATASASLGCKPVLNANLNEKSHKENKPFAPGNDDIFEPVISNHKPVVPSTLSDKKPGVESSIIMPSRSLVCPPTVQLSVRSVATKPKTYKDMTRSLDVATELNSAALPSSADLGHDTAAGCKSVFSANLNNKAHNENKPISLRSDHCLGSLTSEQVPSSLCDKKPSLIDSLATRFNAIDSVCKPVTEPESNAFLDRLSLHLPSSSWANNYTSGPSTSAGFQNTQERVPSFNSAAFNMQNPTAFFSATTGTTSGHNLYDGTSARLGYLQPQSFSRSDISSTGPSFREQLHNMSTFFLPTFDMGGAGTPFGRLRRQF